MFRAGPDTGSRPERKKKRSYPTVPSNWNGIGYKRRSQIDQEGLIQRSHQNRLSDDDADVLLVLQDREALERLVRESQHL